MARFVIFRFLYFLCTFLVVSSNNDTLNNLISSNDDLESNVVENVENETVNNRTLNEIFRDAVQAYLEENWDRCIEDFNAVSHGYKSYKRMITNCRQKCRSKAAGATPMFPENIEDLHFYEKKVRETLCLLLCNQEYREIAGTKALKKLTRATEQKLMERRAYEYLHICYYQRKRYQDAANALFTFLVSHPEHDASIETLKNYLKLPGVEDENVINLESPAYVSVYFKGISAYENEDYVEAVGLFETSLRSYMQEEEECRIYCEGSFDQGWHPEFTSSIANHFAYCLKCKRGCTHMLNNVNGNYHKDILKLHYNYLQFSYYKLGKLKQACAAVASYLLFDPVDETMQQNKEYYSAQPKVSEEYFTPRQEALAYVKRQEYELGLLRFITNEFALIDSKLKVNDKKTDDLGKKPDFNDSLHPPSWRSFFLYEKLSSNLSRAHRDPESFRIKDDIYPTAMEDDLGGKNRYVADGFLDSVQCDSLMKLASISVVEGDGYNENKSPHSKYEIFEGVTIGRIALMVYFGQIEAKWLEILLERTEDCRRHVERYFGLDRPLYFTYTHLVCRTALPDSPMDRDDLSHEVHADNCLLKDNHNCLHESPAYTWRHYSAILYMNDDFKGGEFFFAKNQENRQADRLVFPHCGRMVAFSAGAENLHGVRGVLKGKRCALALWFTQDNRYLEYERVLASAILRRVQLAGPFERKDYQVPLKYEDILVEHVLSDEILKNYLKKY